MPILDRAAGLYRCFIPDYPLAALSGLLLIMTFFAWQARDFRLDASADALMLKSDKDLRLFREISRRYDSRELQFVTFTPDGDLFSSNFIPTIYFGLLTALAMFLALLAALTLLPRLILWWRPF